MPKISQTTKVVRARGVIAGTTKHLLKRKTLQIAGEQRPVKEILALMQSQIDAIDAISRAHVAFTVAVSHERALSKRVRELEAVLKLVVGSEFGVTSAAYADFGWKAPKKPGPKTVAAKAAGAEKARATRKARGTMGSRQRKRSEAARSRV